MIRFLQIIIVSIVLAGCAFKPSIDDAKLSDKTFELEKFFDGKVKAIKLFLSSLDRKTQMQTVSLP